MLYDVDHFNSLLGQGKGELSCAYQPGVTLAINSTVLITETVTWEIKVA